MEDLVGPEAYRFLSRRRLCNQVVGVGAGGIDKQVFDQGRLLAEGLQKALLGV